MKEKILTHFQAAFWAHLIFIACIAALKTAPPVENIEISAQKDALILSGHNIFKMKTIKTFKNWPQLKNYLQSSYIEIRPNSEASLAHNLNSRIDFESFKIYRSKKENSFLLQAPDQESALVFYQNLYFGGLQKGSFGYSIKASNTLYHSILKIGRFSKDFKRP